MIRKVRFPLKFKIITLITALLLIAISFFVLFALNLFHKDKSAYIFETSMLTTENLASQTSNFLGNSLNSLKILSTNFKAGKNHRTTIKLFESNNNIVEFSVYEKKNGKYRNAFTLNNKSLLDLYAHDQNHLKEVIKLIPIPFSAVKESRPYIYNTTITGGLPHITLAIKKKKRIFAIRVLLVQLLDTIKKNAIYQSAVFSLSGSVIATSSKQLSQNKERIIHAISKSKIDHGTLEIQLDNQNVFLLSFAKIPIANLYAISIINKDSAFEAARFLVQKSIYISIIVIAVSAIFGIFFSRSLTSHLEKLFQATLKISKGDFSTQVQVKTRDEIGVLSDSFNYMSQEITRYMDEMKEKARVENELAVAKLVQESFFPGENLNLAKFDLSAFYTPATECGGDWWGHIEHQGKLILFIADATGHGVPAAFLTATANCCSNNLKFLAQDQPQLLDSPSKILEIMNHAICNIAEDILMTCFVAVIDPEQAKMTYANASHNSPLLYHPVNDEPQKSDLTPLLKAQGPRLGHHAQGEFTQEEIEIFANDQLILFTDGVLESTNPEAKQWGQRNFLKSLLKKVNSGPQNTVTSVISDLKSFCNETPFEDDVTFIVTRIKS